MADLIRQLFDKYVLGRRRDLGHGKERQVASRLVGIRKDHTGRYYFADQVLPRSGFILDAACGVGYGAYILAGRKTRKIIAVDKDMSAHFFGQQHYSRANLMRVPLLLEELSVINQKLSGAVSFETIEHLDRPHVFLRNIHAMCENGANLVVSVPNENVLPFTPEKFPYHLRHYTPEAFGELLLSTGWDVVERRSQKTKTSSLPQDNTQGAFLIYTCERVSR